MIRAVVFDLDHTLYDRYGTIALASHTVRERSAVREGITDAEIARVWTEYDKRFVHFGLEKLYSELVNSGIFIQPFPTLDDMIALHYDTYTSYAVPYDFAIPTIKALKERGFMVGLITNGKPHVQYRKLEMLGMENCFDEVIVSGEFGIHKPAPEIFCEMARRLVVKTDEMMYVGDNPINDVKGSAGAGCVPVWVRTTPWNFPDMPLPRLCVDTAAEVLLLDELKR